MQSRTHAHLQPFHEVLESGPLGVAVVKAGLYLGLLEHQRLDERSRVHARLGTFFVGKGATGHSIGREGEGGREGGGVREGEKRERERERESKEAEKKENKEKKPTKQQPVTLHLCVLPLTEVYKSCADFNTKLEICCKHQESQEKDATRTHGLLGICNQGSFCYPYLPEVAPFYWSIALVMSPWK